MPPAQAEGAQGGQKGSGAQSCRALLGTGGDRGDRKAAVAQSPLQARSSDVLLGFLECRTPCPVLRTTLPTQTALLSQNQYLHKYTGSSKRWPCFHKWLLLCWELVQLLTMGLKCLTVALSHRRVVPTCVILRIPNKALGSCHPFQGIQQPTEAVKEFGQQEAVKEKNNMKTFCKGPLRRIGTMWIGERA